MWTSLSKARTIRYLRSIYSSSICHPVLPFGWFLRRWTAMWCHLSTLSRFPSKSCETPALITEKVGVWMCSYVLLAAFRHLHCRVVLPKKWGFWRTEVRGCLGVDGYSCHGIPTDVSTTDRVKGGLFQLLHFLGGKTKKLGKDSEILVSSFGSKCVRIATFAHLEAEAFKKMHWIRVSSPPFSIN